MFRDQRTHVPCDILRWFVVTSISLSSTHNEANKNSELYLTVVQLEKIQLELLNLLNLFLSAGKSPNINVDKSREQHKLIKKLGIKILQLIYYKYNTTIYE